MKIKLKYDMIFFHLGYCGHIPIVQLFEFGALATTVSSAVAGRKQYSMNNNLKGKISQFLLDDKKVDFAIVFAKFNQFYWCQFPNSPNS